MTKLVLSEEERRARRAEQSRLCRAKKAGGVTPQQATAVPVDDAVIAAIKAATADIATYRPMVASAYSEPDLDLEDGTVFMVVQGISGEFDMDNIRQNFADWKHTKPWHDLLRIAVLEVREPGRLPAVQYYIAT